MGVAWCKQRFWNNLKPGRRLPQGTSGSLCVAPPPAPGRALGSLCGRVRAARDAPPPPTAYICWPQLGALGTQRAGRAVGKRALGPRWGRGGGLGEPGGESLRGNLPKPLSARLLTEVTHMKSKRPAGDRRTGLVRHVYGFCGLRTARDRAARI